MSVNTRLLASVLWALTTSHQASSQWLEDFSDGDFTYNPIWYGNSTQWVISEGTLRSNDMEINSSFYLSTPSQRIKSTDWQLSVRLQFNTSSLNYVDIYLAADDSNLTTRVKNGYFVRIGGTKDEICLYKKQDGISYLLLDGIDGSTNRSNTTVVLKITCNEYYKWKLEHNLSGIAQNFTSEGTISDSSINSSSYFGILVAQSTASFFQKHFFDNLSILPILQDRIPPSLLFASAETEHKIKLDFSEELDSTWKTQSNAITLFDSLQNKVSIDSIIQDPFTPFTYYLFPHQLEAGSYRINLQPVKDLTGNEADSITTSITWTPPLLANYKQLLITELLPDPSPPLGLPEIEYIELYNNSSRIFDLEGYLLSDPSTTVSLPSYSFLPNTYLLLCKSSDSASFQPFGNVLPLPSMPSLNNDGDHLLLQNPHSQLVDKVDYDLSWYHDKDKQEGGYSLELIDPKDFCADDKNWKASISSIGGTPGKQNSVFGNVKDTLPPSLTSISILSPILLKIYFSEHMDSLTFLVANCSLSNGIGIEKIGWKSDSLNQIMLSLSTPLQTQISYSLSLTQLKDCAGNVTPPNTFLLAISEPSAIGDVLLNEVLFNPFTGGSDFVEIYNASSKFIDLNGWILANLSVDTVANKKALFKSPRLLEPQKYFAFTSNKSTLLNQYPKAVADNIIELPSLPSYPDDEGTVLLFDFNGKQMDRFDYNQFMQSPLLASKEGVSLEKIHSILPSNEAANWASASKEQGYATPGYQNSQFLLLGLQDESISIDPLIITPNGDGDRDFLIISIQLENISNIGTIIIYDVLGREVKRLLKHSLSGTISTIQWDGTNESNVAVPLGHYIIWIELFNKEGKVMHSKKKAVVGEKF